MDRCRSNRFFFLETVHSIHKNFPQLFEQENEEDEGQGNEETISNTNSSYRQLQQFGIIPYVLTYCKLTNHTFGEAMTHNINTVFYLVSYDLIVNKIKNEEIKKAYKK